MSRSYYAAPGSQIVVVETGRPSEPVQIGTGRTVGEARASLQETPINSSGGDPEGMALRWAHRQGWLDLHPDELTQLDVEEGEDDECDWGAWLATSSAAPSGSDEVTAVYTYAEGTSAVRGEWPCSRREAVKAAVEALGAEHVEGETWRYHADETASDWLVEEDDLIDLGGGLLAGHTLKSLYSHWCAEHEGEEFRA